MSNNQEVRVGDHKFKLVNGVPALVTAGTDEFTPVTLDDIGNISEWLAFAWESLAGEQYRPVTISSGGYVYDDGNGMISQVNAGEYLVPKRFLGFPERDCE